MDHSFLPHGVCFLWSPSVLWLNVIGDILTALAYVLIPLMLIAAVRDLAPAMRHELVYISRWFAAFIILCGLTHVFGVVTVWIPAYYEQGFVKLATGTVSLLAVWQLYRTVKAFSEAFNETLDAQEVQIFTKMVLAKLRGT